MDITLPSFNPQYTCDNNREVSVFQGIQINRVVGSRVRPSRTYRRLRMRDIHVIRILLTLLVLKIGCWSGAYCFKVNKGRACWNVTERV